jgi:hypothetical protein
MWLLGFELRTFGRAVTALNPRAISPGLRIEDFKNDINNSLKEIQKNTGKQIEALKKGNTKSHKKLQENTVKHLKEVNKTIQDLKMEIEIINKSQWETTL